MVRILETVTENELIAMGSVVDDETHLTDDPEIMIMQRINKHTTLDKWWVYRDYLTDAACVNGFLAVTQAMVDHIEGDSTALDAINATRNPENQIDPSAWSNVSSVDVADLITSGYLPDEE